MRDTEKKIATDLLLCTVVKNGPPNTTRMFHPPTCSVKCAVKVQIYSKSVFGNNFETHHNCITYMEKHFKRKLFLSINPYQYYASR